MVCKVMLLNQMELSYRSSIADIISTLFIIDIVKKPHSHNDWFKWGYQKRWNIQWRWYIYAVDKNRQRSLIVLCFSSLCFLSICISRSSIWINASSYQGHSSFFFATICYTISFLKLHFMKQILCTAICKQFHFSNLFILWFVTAK